MWLVNAVELTYGVKGARELRLLRASALPGVYHEIGVIV